jgi:hypothetical protein
MQYWAKATSRLPYYAKNGVVGAPPHGRYLYTASPEVAHCVSAIINSSLFYVYFISNGDCFHLNDGLVQSFPVADTVWSDATLVSLNRALMERLRETAETKSIATRDGQTIKYEEFSAGHAKPLVDEIDHCLAKHYAITEEELDFIVNYDIKYRMGGVDGNDEDSE